jgi:hypothetical protein
MATVISPLRKWISFFFSFLGYFTTLYPTSARKPVLHNFFHRESFFFYVPLNAEEDYFVYCAVLIQINFVL